jgi:O-antigen ligase
MLLQFLAYLALFLAVLIYADTETRAKRIALAIMASGILYSIYGIVSNPYLPADTYQFATFVNRNHFAAYVEMIIPVTIAYSLLARSRTVRGAVIFAASIMVTALFLSLSRAGRICFMISMVTFVVLLGIKRPGKNTFMAIILLLILSLFFMFSIGLETTLKRMDTLLDPAKAFFGRAEMYKDTLNIIKDFPVLGTGLGTFKDIAEMYKTLRIQRMYVFTHNEPLQLLSETGLAGFLLILLFLILYSKDVFLVWFKRHSPFAVYMAIGGMTGLFSVGLHSFFEFPLHIPGDAVLFFLMLGLSYRFVTLEGGGVKYGGAIEFKLPKSAKMFSLVMLAIVFLFTETLIVKRYLAQAAFERVKEGDMTAQDALRSIGRAITLNPGNSLYLNKKGDLLLKEKDFALAEEFYKRAIDLNPTSADYHLDLGHLYIVTGREDLADEEFRRAALLNPQGIRKG